MYENEGKSKDMNKDEKIPWILYTYKIPMDINKQEEKIPWI